MGQSDIRQKKSGYEEAIESRQSVEQEYSLWVLLNQARDSLYKAREKELADYGISAAQAAVLFIVKMIDGEVTPSEISRWLLKEPHTVSALLARMEDKGLVKREKNPGNKRSINITLTEAGERAFYDSKKAAAIKDIMSCLSPEESKQLSLILAKVRDAAIYNTSRVRVPFP